MSETIIRAADLIPATLPAPINGKTYTYEDIGHILKVTAGAANQMTIGRGAYSGEHRHSPEVTARIEAAKHLAQTMGIKPRRHSEPTYYRGGNYLTRKEEIARMRTLREEGRNNEEIARIVGRTTNTVRRNIGVQPEGITEMNRKLYWERRRQAIAARRAYVIKAQVDAHNQQVDALNAQITEMRKLERSLAEMRRNAENTRATVDASRTKLTPIATEAGLTLHEAATF